ncbi:GTPase-activating protein CdGAPr [Daktulosphaira vitifoliae]|uniref:GTPase-activating protein CdGAPr n=1 Tax=Daktulosphaira vitifoliae TaxID=58002 RepID=UPI0021AAB0CB|nr:GTPase-activating protein CdGAPr [Daktulosphaira vitifoliae]
MSLKMTDYSGLNRNSEVRSSGSSLISNSSIRMSTLPITSVEDGKSRFPKLEECAHFHYEHVDLGFLKLEFIEDDIQKCISVDDNFWFTIKVNSQSSVWVLKRSYENAKTLDRQLHKCVYDRKFSLLPELRSIPNNCENPNKYIKNLMSNYCSRLSQIATGSLINCGPILSWFELDNRGHHLLVADGDQCAINTPAVAAAYSVRKYTANATDELSFDVGDIISVIDMPPPEDSTWWRGKHGFLVGFFPSNCVVVITDKVPRNLYVNPQMICFSEPSKPVLRKHGKLISFFRSFILSRPTRRTLKQSGILKERVFGCDLGEHLLNSGKDFPDVLTSCTEFIEKFGIVDGIYRLSGVTSNIQKLRSTFDEDKIPELWEDESIKQDIHSVASLLKLYFRELPNPLCTYQLYDSFVNAVQAIPEKSTEDKLRLMRETVQKLPPPHFRTLEYLMKHLSRVASLGKKTGMTARNIAIVWAPNLLRSKQLETGSGVAALHGVGIQAVVTEFLILYTEYIFSLTCNVGSSLPPLQGSLKKSRPKSLAISTHTKLLTLEEAQNRVKKSDTNYIEVGGGPSCLPQKYHTIIDLPSKRHNINKRRSPLRWKSFFTRGGSSVSLGVMPSRKKSEPTLTPFKTAKSKNGMEKSIERNIDIPDSPKSKISSETMSLKEIKSTPPCSSPLICGSIINGHNRSVSHDSYFDQLADQEELDESLAHHASQEDLSDLQVNFDLDESDLRVFSDEDTTNIFSDRSSIENIPIINDNILNNSSKRLPILAHPEDLLSNDPSPKKKKTGDSIKNDDFTKNNRLSYLEERFASSDIRFIDSQSPEHMTVSVDVHLSCDQIMTDIENNKTETSSFSSIATPTHSYHLLLEENCSEYCTTFGCQDDFKVPKQKENIFLITPRNRLSFQGDERNKMLSNDRHSFQEIKYRNSKTCNNHDLHDTLSKQKTSEDINLSTFYEKNVPKLLKNPCEIKEDITQEQFNKSSSILDNDDLNNEENIYLSKYSSSGDSLEQRKSNDSINYEVLMTTSTESNKSSHHEMSISPEESEELNKLQICTKPEFLYDNYEKSTTNIVCDLIPDEGAELLIQDISSSNNDYNEPAEQARTEGEEFTCNIGTSCCKFESKIGRDFEHEKQIKKELMENASSTGNKESIINVQELMYKFDVNKSMKNCPTWIKNRRLRNNCQKINTIVSSDTFNMPSDDKIKQVTVFENVINLDSEYHMFESSSDIDTLRRERIDRYKEERRQALRERFKTTECTLNDDDVIKRLRAKTLKTLDENTDDKSYLNTLEKNLVKITSYNEQENLTSNTEKKDWYTRSLERQKNIGGKNIGFVKLRVNQLIENSNISTDNNNQSILKTNIDTSSTIPYGIY